MTTGSWTNAQGLGIDDFTMSLTTSVAGPDLYWAGGSWTATAPGAGGNGSWADGSGSWDASKTANFGGTAGTVAVGTVTASNGLVFTTSGYTLSGGTFTLAGASSGLNSITTGTDDTVSTTISSVIAGSAGLTKAGPGTLTLSGSNSYSGPTAVNAGVLAFGASNVLSDATAVTVAGGSLDLGGHSDTVADFTITSGSLVGSGKLTAGSYSLGGGAVAGNLGTGTMTVTGTTVLNGTADVTAVNLNAGTLALGSAGRLTSDQVAITGSSGASISLGGDESVGSLAGGFDAALGSGTLTAGNDNTSTTYSGDVSGSGGLTKAGSGRLTLSGSNSYSGLTTISGGTLALSGSGSIGTGGLDLGTSGIFDLAALTSDTYALPATGDLTGAGMLSGNGKTLAVFGSFLPGNSPGTVTLDSGFTLDLSNSDTSLFQITSPFYTADSFDLVNGAGSVIFGGILDLDFSGGSYAAGTNVLQLFANAGGFSGNFSSVVWTGLAYGQTAIFDASTGYVSITAGGVPEIDPAGVGSVLALITGVLGLLERRRLKAKAA